MKRVWSEQAEKKKVTVKDDSNAATVEKTVYPSPIEGCYKILAVDDQGNTVSTPDGTTLVNVILQKSGEDFFVSPSSICLLVIRGLNNNNRALPCEMRAPRL